MRPRLPTTSMLATRQAAKHVCKYIYNMYIHTRICMHMCIYIYIEIFGAFLVTFLEFGVFLEPLCVVRQAASTPTLFLVFSLPSRPCRSCPPRRLGELKGICRKGQTSYISGSGRYPEVRSTEQRRVLARTSSFYKVCIHQPQGPFQEKVKIVGRSS